MLSVIHFAVLYLGFTFAQIEGHRNLGKKSIVTSEVSH